MRRPIRRWSTARAARISIARLQRLAPAHAAGLHPSAIDLIFDEVFVGLQARRRGRSGIFPPCAADMVTYGKSCAGGLPVGVSAGART